MSTPKSTKPIPDGMFSSEAIRFLVGFIALTLPVLATIVSSFAPLTSISASYYTDARNMFVGLLFVLGAFLFTYQGHNEKENWVANLGALAAFVAALYPTACDTCQQGVISYIHLGAGATLFFVTFWFCWWPFRQAASAKPGVEAGRRVKLYKFCGLVIIVCLVTLAALFLLNSPITKALRLTFWGETIMLCAFSAAWFAAAQWFPWFTSKNEQKKTNMVEALGLDALNVSKNREK